MRKRRLEDGVEEGKGREEGLGRPDLCGRVEGSPPAGQAQRERRSRSPVWVGKAGPRARSAGWEDRVCLNKMSSETGVGRNKKLSLASLYWVTCWRFSCA